MSGRGGEDDTCPRCGCAECICGDFWIGDADDAPIPPASTDTTGGAE